MLLEQGPINPGLPVEALEVSPGAEPDEVPVAFRVLRQDYEMGVLRRSVFRFLAGPTVAVSHVRLEPEHRSEASLSGPLLEVPGAVQIAVVGEGERRHPQLLGPVEQRIDPVGPVEKGILTMRMEMNERHRRRPGVSRRGS